MGQVMVPGAPSGPRAEKQQRVTQYFKFRDPSKPAPAPAPPTEAQQRAAAAKRAAETAVKLAKAAKHGRTKRCAKKGARWRRPVNPLTAFDALTRPAPASKDEHSADEEESASSSSSSSSSSRNDSDRSDA